MLRLRITSECTPVAVKCSAAFEGDGMLRFSESVSGSYNFATAIPMNRLVEFLREYGVDV